jgi:curved DNA-binding protein CbpA
MNNEKQIDHVEAMKILEINKKKGLTMEYIKKQYHNLSLKNHPDKNGNTSESNEKFKKINEAYEFLKKEQHFLNIDIDLDDMNTNINSPSTLYYDMLQTFLKMMLEKSDFCYTDVFSNIIKEIVSGFHVIKQRLSHKLFDGLDKDTSIKIYSFLSKYRSILHLSEELLEEVKEIISKKFADLQIYKLNPSITDLLQNNIYKLYVDNELYLVPLWFNEHYFDSNGKEIMVICDPELEENIQIDDDNNIVTQIILSSSLLANSILNEENVEVVVGTKVLYIPLSKLYMKREQEYRLANQGLAKEKEDVYDVTERADIIVRILIE